MMALAMKFLRIGIAVWELVEKGDGDGAKRRARELMEREVNLAIAKARLQERKK